MSRRAAVGILAKNAREKLQIASLPDAPTIFPQKTI
jgi:hypothetical protein